MSDPLTAETVVTLGRGLKVRVTHTELRTLQQWLVTSFATGPVRLTECQIEGRHQWRGEKEFANCGRCHEVKAMRDFAPGEYHRGY